MFQKIVKLIKIVVISREKIIFDPVTDKKCEDCEGSGADVWGTCFDCDGKGFVTKTRKELWEEELSKP